MSIKSKIMSSNIIITKKSKSEISIILNCSEDKAHKVKVFLQFIADHLNSDEISRLKGKLSIPLAENFALKKLKDYIKD
jgi:hypothetical protein